MLPFSALPFHCLTSQSLLLLFHAYQSLSVSLCAPPVISLPFPHSAHQSASIPCQLSAFSDHVRTLPIHVNSLLLGSLPFLGVSAGIVLHLSIPFPLRSHRFRISRCYSHPCHSFSPQSCSVLFRFCLFACPIKSKSDQRFSVSFRIYTSQFSSFSVHLYANPVLSQRLHLGATPRHSISPRGRAIPYRILAMPCCAVACQIIACLFRFIALLTYSFAALFTIQGVLTPCLLSAF